MFSNEKELIDHLKSGHTVKASFNGKNGELKYEERSGKVLMSIPPLQNGRSRSFIYVMGSSIIKFKNLEILGNE